MKTPSAPVIRPILLALMLALPAAGQGARGQRPAGEGDIFRTLISLSFPGGTVTQYLASVQRVAGEINVIVAPEAQNVFVPAVTLKDVTVTSAINLINGRTRDEGTRSITINVEHMPTYAQGERKTFQILARVHGARHVSVARVWTVTNLLDNEIPSEAVLSAVEMALEVVGSETKLDVRFHGDTGLLIASGDPYQLEAIEEVLDRLNDSVAGRLAIAQVEVDAADFKAARDEVGALRQEVTRLELRARQLEDMLVAKEHERAELVAELRAAQIELLKERERSRRERRSSDPGE